MDCSEEMSGMLFLYLLGKLTEEEEESVEKHLLECPSCRREVEELVPIAEKFRLFAKQDHIIEWLVSKGAEAKEKLDYSLAIRCYRLASELDPYEPDYFYELGKLHFARKEFDEARVALEKCVDGDPANFSPHYFLAAVYDVQGRFDEVVEIYERALKTFPESSEIRFFISCIYLQMYFDSDYSEIEHLEKARFYAKEALKHSNIDMLFSYFPAGEGEFRRGIIFRAFFKSILFTVSSADGLALFIAKNIKFLRKAASALFLRPQIFVYRKTVLDFAESGATV